LGETKLKSSGYSDEAVRIRGRAWRGTTVQKFVAPRGIRDFRQTWRGWRTAATRREKKLVFSATRERDAGLAPHLAVTLANREVGRLARSLHRSPSISPAHSGWITHFGGRLAVRSPGTVIRRTWVTVGRRSNTRVVRVIGPNEPAPAFATTSGQWPVAARHGVWLLRVARLPSATRCPHAYTSGHLLLRTAGALPTARTDGEFHDRLAPS